MKNNVYTVGQVNAYIRNMFTQDFMLNRLYIKGEVSNLKYHTSGHIYFSLKDSTGSIACVMFAGSRKGLAFRMENGQSVVVLGSVSVYERDGKYQVYAKEIIQDGAGLLWQRFEALKKELLDMGMFAEEYKRPIPAYAKRVGVVTASTGAAIRDIINISRRRNPYVQLILYPALVQGDGAVKSIISGIRTLDKAGVDVMIVGRGGGSIEDLWAFNEEAVARAIFDCETPVISAVGHETDTTIADYVADLRAPTPSAAAELAVFDYRAVAGSMEEYRGRLSMLMDRHITVAREQTERFRLQLSYLRPENRLRELRQQTADLMDRLRERMERRVKERRNTFSLYVEKLNGLSPLEKLSQGYSYVEDANREAVSEIGPVKPGDELTIHVIDGRIRTRVLTKEQVERLGR